MIHLSGIEHQMVRSIGYEKGMVAASNISAAIAAETTALLGRATRGYADLRREATHANKPVVAAVIPFYAGSTADEVSVTTDAHGREGNCDRSSERRRAAMVCYSSASSVWYVQRSYDANRTTTNQPITLNHPYKLSSASTRRLSQTLTRWRPRGSR